jgi:hypothetical protein
MKYTIACFAGSTFKQNLLPEGAKFRNTPQLVAVIGILKILPIYFLQLEINTDGKLTPHK